MTASSRVLPRLSSLTINGSRTEWSPVRSVIITVTVSEKRELMHSFQVKMSKIKENITGGDTV